MHWYNGRSALFAGLANSNAKILIHFSNKIRGSNFINNTGNCYGRKLPKCWLQFKGKITVSFIIILGTLSFPIGWFVASGWEKRPLPWSFRQFLTLLPLGYFSLCIFAIILRNVKQTRSLCHCCDQESAVHLPTETLPTTQWLYCQFTMVVSFGSLAHLP